MSRRAQGDIADLIRIGVAGNRSANPAFDLALDPNCISGPQRTTSWKPAFAHPLIDRRTFEAHPGHDLGQTNEPARRVWLLGVGFNGFCHGSNSSLRASHALTNQIAAPVELGNVLRQRLGEQLCGPDRPARTQFFDVLAELFDDLERSALEQFAQKLRRASARPGQSEILANQHQQQQGFFAG